MERFAQKGRVLLGTSSKEPDIDFNDVFGGPPKRSPSHDLRYSFTEARRYNLRTQEGDEDVFLPRDPWSGMRERRVFGEEASSRRKHLSEDFYDDVFRGEEAVGSPRRTSHEPFGSSPRALSHSRTLSPRMDPFGTSLSSQIQFSLPAKLTRGTDSPTFASENHKYKEPISNVKAFPYTPSSPVSRPSPLSHEVSFIGEVPSLAIRPEELKSPEVQSKVKSDFERTEAGNIGNQFHFSIYKWPSKGVPISMPPKGVKSTKLKDAIKTEIFSSSDETTESLKMANGSQKSDVHDSKSKASSTNKVHRAEERKEDRGSPHKFVTDGVKETGRSKTTDMDFETVSIGATSSAKRVEIKGVAQAAQEARKPELKPLRSFLATSEDEGNDKTSKTSEPKQNASKKATASDTNADVSKVQKHDEESEQKDHAIKKATASDKNEDVGKKEPTRDEKKYNSKLEEVSMANRKAKEFVKISNQEADLRPKTDTEGDKETSAKTRQTNGNRVHGLDKIQTPANAPVVNLEESKKPYSHLNTSVADAKGTFDDQKEDPASNSELHPDNTQAIDEDIDDLFPENFTVQELSTDQDKPVKGEDNYEDIQTSDDRIRKWSRGKEGNIRSLLSTLQYVLWEGSGWKPVPLVDIIEENAVKRSYQRALLCLHPDKLQQKGAADYQKYIAQKVFDILQEAWDQFNSLGLM